MNTPIYLAELFANIRYAIWLCESHKFENTDHAVCDAVEQSPQRDHFFKYLNECDDCMKKTMDGRKIWTDEIINTLNSKESFDFYYSKETDFMATDYSKFDKSRTIDDFRQATQYYYNDTTLDWIFKSMAPKCMPSQSLLFELKISGIVDVSNGNKYFEGSRALDTATCSVSDMEIKWLIEDYGLKPSENVYERYGTRKDRTFNEKITMFDYFASKKIKPSFNAFSECLQFSKKAVEVIGFICWMANINFPTKISTSCIMGNSFLHFDTDLFPFLYNFQHPKYNFRMNNSDLLVSIHSYRNPSIEERMKAILFVKQYEIYKINSHILQTSLEFNDINFVKFLIDNGAIVTSDFIEGLLCRLGYSYKEVKPIDFIKEIITYCFQKRNITFSIEYSLLFNPEYYIHKQEMYDWFFNTFPEMEEYRQKRIYIDAERQKKWDDEAEKNRKEEIEKNKRNNDSYCYGDYDSDYDSYDD